MKDTPPRHQRRKQARPQELLDAAADLFVEKGFAATRIEEVARRAGVSKGTLYLYYSSKEDLLKALIKNTLSATIHEGRQELEQYDLSCSELLTMALQVWWNKVGETRAGGICKLIISEARNFPELTQFYMDEVTRPGNKLIKDLIDRGIARQEFRPIDSEYAAKTLISAMQFVMIHNNSVGCCSHNNLTDSDRFLSTLMDVVLHGLVKPSHPNNESSIDEKF